MSFGDQNNPYGPPQGQQPGYGQPQGQPAYGQPQGQPGYGYPQAPPLGDYGQQPVLTTMPGTVSTARVLMWVIVGLQVIGVIIYALLVRTISVAKNDAELKDNSAFQQLADQSSGVVWACMIFAVAWLVFAIVLAVKFNSGGNGVRITIMVFAIITAILGIYPFLVVGLLHTVLAILVAVFVGNANGSAWFNRPRQVGY
ncbi:hypothetical protein NGF19_26350 [Streptomyces sp. RY43-2]|uniref:Integral membrane protein n=1 Tax=Streptomyces macrolidinus TaxID=2952607 RepID=A0ABT0ZL56_9ACTN|nr:hypothetical protein [Streptomyces macrolidinus]MCN9244262.1 hypothetical protein [Streptomyces macrolidinus]